MRKIRKFGRQYTEIRNPTEKHNRTPSFFIKSDKLEPSLENVIKYEAFLWKLYQWKESNILKGSYRFEGDTCGHEDFDSLPEIKMSEFLFRSYPKRIAIVSAVFYTVLFEYFRKNVELPPEEMWSRIKSYVLGQGYTPRYNLFINGRVYPMYLTKVKNFDYFSFHRRYTKSFR